MECSVAAEHQLELEGVAPGGIPVLNPCDVPRVGSVSLPARQCCGIGEQQDMQVVCER